jgi:hypothetical protein
MVIASTGDQHPSCTAAHMIYPAGILSDDPRDKLVYVSVIVRDGLALYSAHYTGPQGSEASPDVARFLSSFQLIPR